MELCDIVRGLDVAALDTLVKLTLHEIGSSMVDDAERQAAARALN